MRQTLFSIPDEVLGIPVFGFGILLIAWTAFSVALVFWLVRRQGFSTDTRGYLPLVIVVAIVIVFLLPILIEEGGLPIRGYGVMFLLGVVAGVALAVYRAPAARLDAETVVSLAFWMIASGIIGARLFHVIEYWDSSYRQQAADGSLDLVATLQAIMNVPKGGLVVYGSLIGAAPVTIWLVRKYKLPSLAVADLAAPSIMLALAFGRIGCLLNGCCYGGACELPWAITFPQRSGATGYTPPYMRQIEHGWLFGVQIGVQPDGTLVIENVQAGSNAQAEGIRVGDRVEKIDGIQIAPEVVDGQETSAVEVLRDHFRYKVALLIEARNREGDLKKEAYLRWMPPERGQSREEDIFETLQRGFGVRFAQRGGLIIEGVQPRSPGAYQGLRTGDIVTRLDGEPVSLLSDARRIMNSKAVTELKIASDPIPKSITWMLPPRSLPLQPTQVYSAINALLICLFLLAYSPFRRRDGEVFALLITIYPVTRFLLEIIRTDEAAMFGTGFSISQLVSFGLLFAVVGLWIYIFRQPIGKLWAEAGD